MNDRLKILDVWVDTVNMDQAIERIYKYLMTSNRPRSIFAVNPEKSFSVPKDPLLHKIFKAADMLIPDGIGVVLAARFLHGRKLSRVPGVELMEKICQLSAQTGYRLFIYGAKEEVNKTAVGELRNRYPDLKIVGRSNGYLEEDKMDALIEKINNSEAEILFIALGSPRQEKWYAKYKDKLESVKICQGIGGSLDAITGNVKRAPKFWIDLNLEWLYRLISEPERIKRQKVLPIFAGKVFLSIFRS